MTNSSLYTDPTPIFPINPEYTTERVNPLILNQTKNIRRKMFGSDVRESLARGLEISGEESGTALKLSKKTYEKQEKLEVDFQKVLSETTSDSEVIQARGKFPILGERLDSTSRDVSYTLNYVGQLLSVYKMQQNEAVEIGIVGDSLSEGAGQIGSDEKPEVSYPEVLEKNLRKIYNNQKISVNNQGKGGWSTRTWIKDDRLDYFVLDKNPDLVIIMLGFNDVHTPVNLEEYTSNLTNLVNRCKEANADVIICSPPVSYREEFNGHKNVTAILKQFSDASRLVAATTNTMFIDVNGEFEKLFYENKSLKISDVFGADLVHMTNYKYLADIITKGFQGNKVFVPSEDDILPVVGVPYVTTDMKDSLKFKVESGPFSWGYAFSNSNYVKLNIFVNKRNLSLRIHYAISKNSGDLLIYDNGKLIEEINQDYEIPSDNFLYNKFRTIGEELSIGYHEIIIKTNSLIINPVNITGFSFVSNSNTKVLTNGMYEQFKQSERKVVPFANFDISNKTGITINVLGSFKNNTALLLFAEGFKCPLNVTFLENKICVVESFSNGDNGRLTKGNTIFNLSNQLKININIYRDKINIYVNGVLEIDLKYTKSFDLSGDISIYGLDKERVSDVFLDKIYMALFG